jgi:hypothetical protein
MYQKISLTYAYGICTLVCIFQYKREKGHFLTPSFGNDFWKN